MVGRNAVCGSVSTKPCSHICSTQTTSTGRETSSIHRFAVRACRAWWNKTGPNPADRRKSGSKHHVVTDANGIPFAATLTGANAHDVTQLLPLVDAIPAVAGKLAALVAVRNASKAIAPETRSPTANNSGSAGLNLFWRKETPSMEVAWEKHAGSLNAPSVGYIKCDAYARDSTVATISIKPS